VDIPLIIGAQASTGSTSLLGVNRVVEGDGDVVLGAAAVASDGVGSAVRHTYRAAASAAPSATTASLVAVLFPCRINRPSASSVVGCGFVSVTQKRARPKLGWWVTCSRSSGYSQVTDGAAMAGSVFG
jgi:hypothetical protein